MKPFFAWLVVNQRAFFAFAVSGATLVTIGVVLIAARFWGRS